MPRPSLAVGLAILVTRPAGVEVLALSRSVANIGQTFPPVAVLAIAVPLLGFGTAPTLVALFLYGLLPIFENALTGLTTLPPDVMEAARGVGMTGTQQLLKVEVPLALPVILAGIPAPGRRSRSQPPPSAPRLSRRTRWARSSSPASPPTTPHRVLQGGLIVAVMAILIYDGISALERQLMARTGRRLRSS